jgi:hypothetical protein
VSRFECVCRIATEYEGGASEGYELSSRWARGMLSSEKADVGVVGGKSV